MRSVCAAPVAPFDMVVESGRTPHVFSRLFLTICLELQLLNKGLLSDICRWKEITIRVGNLSVQGRTMDEGNDGSR